MADLSRTGEWTGALRVLAGLPPLPTAEEDLARLGEALGLAEGPVSRQNLIFLVALTVPWDLAEPWLRDVARSEDADDAEDATCALAFSGEPDAREMFRRLARSPVTDASRLVCELRHAALGEEGSRAARRLLRSYRAIEVLDREPYFGVTVTLAYYEWRPHPSPADVPGLSRELLPLWLERYPGHPGSDDMAWRLGTLEADALAAARWYARSLALPDQDMLRASLFSLVRVAELRLSPHEIDLLAHERGVDSPNRTLLLYVRARRLAASEGFGMGLAAARTAAEEEPHSAIADGWRRRWSVPPPDGLDSGPDPVAAEDPLRAWQLPVEPPDPAARPDRIDREDYRPDPPQERRVEPPREAIALDTYGLARQLRAWETLAELERRGDSADNLYRMAAVFYHNPRVLFPVYARQTENFAHMMDPWPRGDDDAFARVEAESYSLARAIALFDRIERDQAGYAALDRVLFSRAMARKKLLDYLPMRHSRPSSEEAVRLIVADFERCAALFPRSPLADDALRAAAYWRSRSR